MNENTLEYEYALVGNLLSGGRQRASTLDLIRKCRFKPEYITQPALRTAYDILVAEQSNDRTILASVARSKVDPNTLIQCAEKMSGDPLDVERVFLAVKDASEKKEILDKINKAFQVKGATSGHIAANLSRDLGDYLRSIMATSASSGIPISDLKDAKAEEDDPNCLFQGRFLVKGAPLVLSSVSGSGKSVIALQLAYAWALGKPAFGINPLRPLKIGIFQTEDDDNEMAEFRSSMRQGYERFHGWTADDIAQAESNILTYPMNGEVGDAFISYFQRVQQIDKCDLVIINPLQGVTDFDISDNTKMREFVRQKLDGVIKLVNDEEKCGLLIIHHTNKPPAPNMRTSLSTDPYAQYGMAGAAELTNWMRAMLVIDRNKKVPVPGQYQLVAAKRGKRLGWPPLAEPTIHPTKLIRYSTPEEKLIFWHEVEDVGTPRASVEKPSVTKDAADVANYLKDNALPLTEARKFAKELLGRKRGYAAYDELTAKLSDYEVVIAPTGISTQKVIGSRKSVENAISTLRGKHLQDVAVKFGKNELE